VEQLRIAHVFHLLQRLIRRLKETLREKGPGGGGNPNFLFVVSRDDDLLHGVFPLGLMHYTDHTLFTRHLPLRCERHAGCKERREPYGAYECKGYATQQQSAFREKIRRKSRAPHFR
jgi:hypothetical protein